MKIFVTGANGFLGSHVVKQALTRGWSAAGLVRQESDRSLIDSLDELELIEGSLDDIDKFANILTDCQTVIHCAAATSEMTSDWELSRKINVEATRQLAEAANKAGVARFVYISSQSAHEKNNSPYGQTKLEGEKALKDTEIAYTILRPGVIYGPEKRGIFAKLEDQLRKLPAIPLIGDGKYKQYPVHVDDVAWAVLETTTHDNCVNKTYDIAGQEPIEFRNLIKHLLNKLKLKKAVIPLPIWFCRILATFGGLVMKNPPINHSNIEGLLTAPPLDISSAQRDFNYQPRALE